MNSALKPDLYLNSVYELDPDLLAEKGISAIIIDIDNTLVTWDTVEPDEKVNQLVNSLIKKGFRLCMLSNNTRKRVEVFNKYLKLPAVYKAVKPSRKAFLRAMKLLDTTAERTAVIGDQLFTDIYGGNRMGLYTILVSPISEKEFIWTRLVRRIEKMILARDVDRRK